MQQLTSTKAKIIALEIICFLFILLFTYAAAIKLLDRELFTVQMGLSPLLTDFAEILAWAVPLTELLIAAMLAMARSRLAGLYASFGLMVMFTVYIIIILQSSEEIPCACGGILESMGWTEHLIFNIGFVILGLGGILLHTRLAESNRLSTAYRR
ncbi:hypothetical protein QQ020_35125 [Fulvivirgaceae bacterium BMA12]|uniref:Methylamine utilisation protein MauE domain-containing protein n=1 Tax=Agaribacillus aureus TaxID=3051825 RepID=A0ABT8LHS4_9BACT|nr:hypothetical protein [Fulvivirgaceae bacterium BMA12]